MHETKDTSQELDELQHALAESQARTRALEQLIAGRACQFGLALRHWRQNPLALRQFLGLLVRGLILHPATKADIRRIFLVEPFEPFFRNFHRAPARLLQRVFARRPIIINETWPIDRPLVSVIIPCYNYGKYLPDAVESVRNQTWKNLEIIIIEGGSTDDHTKQVVRSFEGGKIRCVYQPERRSIGENRLTGLLNARGKYAVFLDADDMLDPTYLEKAVFLMETKGLDVVTPWAKLLGERTQIRKALQGSPEDYWETLGIPVPEILNGNQCDTTAMFRYSFWKDNDIGYNCKLQLEDWDFWIRFARHGARFAVIKEPLHLYRLHGTSTTNALADTYKQHLQAIRDEWQWLRDDRNQLSKALHRQRQKPRVKSPTANLHSLKGSKDKLQVLLCVPWFDMGGSSVLMKEIFSHLAESVEVTAVATIPSNDEFSTNGVFLYESFARECFRLRPECRPEANQDFLSYLVSTRGIEVVFVVGSRLAYEALPRLKRETPRLKVIDQLYNPIGHVKSNQEFRKYIDFNIAASDEVVAKLIEMGEKPARIKVIPHGVDETIFDPEKLIVQIENTNAVPTQFRFGFLGRLSEEKRPEIMIELARRIPNAQFIIGGTGAMSQQIKDEIESKNLRNVSLLGYVADPCQVYCNSDAIVIPSRIEGLPITLLEAMALQKPVIASDVGQIGQAISNGTNGYLFQSGDLDTLERIARQLMETGSDERKNIGIRARETILEKYTIRKCAAEYLRYAFTK